MDKYLQANRALWDEWTGINYRSDFYKVEAFKAGQNRLRDYEMEEIGPVEGKSLLHLQCHFGLDTLSWARLGARVTGVDFSPEAIKLARSLADEIGLHARFVCADLYGLPGALDERFDVVFTSYGVLFWLKDLARWAQIVARFLKPGGTFYVVELHPFINLFDNEDDVTGFRVRWPYFHAAGPVAVETHGTYADPQADYHSVEYSWGFGLGEVIN